MAGRAEADFQDGLTVVSTIGGSITGFLDGASVVAKFASPTDVAILDGIIYVADLGNHSIRKVYKK